MYKNKKTFIFIRLTLSLLILIFLFLKLDIGKIFDFIQQSNIWLILIAVFLKIIVLGLSALNLIILSTTLNKKIKFLEMLKIYNLSWSIGAFFPGRLGELSIMYFLKNKRFTGGESLSLFMIDKLISILVTGIISVFGIWFLLGIEIAITTILILVLIVIGILIISLNQKLRNFIKNKVLKKHASLFKRFHKSFKASISNFYVLIINFFITIMKWVINALAVYFVFLAFQTRVDFLSVFMITCMGVIISMIPISFNGLGIRESTFVFFYSLLGLDPHLVLGVSLILLFINYIMPAVILINNQNFVRNINKEARL